MAKDQRKIAGSVRVAGKGVFREGQEDELEKALSDAEKQSLTERGVISGFVKEKKAEKPDSK